MNGVCADPIDRIGESLPMARELRPQWDDRTLRALGASEVTSEVTNEKDLEDGHHLILNFVIRAVK